MSRLVNIMPMAGLGKRFLNSQYKLPKPLIKINNNPMFIEASKSMLDADLNIYICNTKLVNEYSIKNILDRYKKDNFIIISIDHLTQGQANTCMLAEKYLQDNDVLFIHSCDSLIEYNKDDLIEKLKIFDSIILTTSPNEHHLKNINQYGWVSNNNGLIKNITCKQKASKNPENDNVIIGSFAFKNKNSFIKPAYSLIEKKNTINNEYYMDMVMKESLSLNYKIFEYRVSSYESWGTPDELSNWYNVKKS